MQFGFHHLAQGHLDIQLGEAGIRTSDLLNTRQPALPPKLQLPSPQCCLSSTSHRCSFGLISGKFGGQVNTLNSLLCSSNLSGAIITVWQGVLSCWYRPLPSGYTVSIKGCTWSTTVQQHTHPAIHIMSKKTGCIRPGQLLPLLCGPVLKLTFPL